MAPRARPNHAESSSVAAASVLAPAGGEHTGRNLTARSELRLQKISAGGSAWAAAKESLSL